eukprot:1157414-Pelagomonas_calceolata.AAC.2
MAPKLHEWYLPIMHVCTAPHARAGDHVVVRLFGDKCVRSRDKVPQVGKAIMNMTGIEISYQLI